MKLFGAARYGVKLFWSARYSVKLFWSARYGVKLFWSARYGVKHLHDNGLCHTDIKLSNIMLAFDSKTGRPLLKLTDYGKAYH